MIDLMAPLHSLVDGLRINKEVLPKARCYYKALVSYTKENVKPTTSNYEEGVCWGGGGVLKIIQPN